MLSVYKVFMMPVICWREYNKCWGNLQKQDPPQQFSSGSLIGNSKFEDKQVILNLLDGVVRQMESNHTSFTHYCLENQNSHIMANKVLIVFSYLDEIWRSFFHYVKLSNIFFLHYKVNLVCKAFLKQVYRHNSTSLQFSSSCWLMWIWMDSKS